jgi:hypothetical protein
MHTVFVCKSNVLRDLLVISQAVSDARTSFAGDAPSFEVLIVEEWLG